MMESRVNKNHNTGAQRKIIFSGLSSKPKSRTDHLLPVIIKPSYLYITGKSSFNAHSRDEMRILKNLGIKFRKLG
jgi:hypothetical protein